MRKITKILLSIGLLCGGSILATLIAQGMGNKVSTGGIGPFIIYPAVFAGIVAIWKYNPEKKAEAEKQEEDKYTLRKD